MRNRFHEHMLLGFNEVERLIDSDSILAARNDFGKLVSSQVTCSNLGR